MRAGHQRGFAKLLIQLLRHVIHRAPAFFMRPPPKCRVRVGRTGQTDTLPHRPPPSIPNCSQCGLESGRKPRLARAGAGMIIAVKVREHDFMGEER